MSAPDLDMILFDPMKRRRSFPRRFQSLEGSRKDCFTLPTTVVFEWIVKIAAFLVFCVEYGEQLFWLGVDGASS